MHASTCVRSDKLVTSVLSLRFRGTVSGLPRPSQGQAAQCDEMDV